MDYTVSEWLWENHLTSLWKGKMSQKVWTLTEIIKYPVQCLTVNRHSVDLRLSTLPSNLLTSFQFIPIFWSHPSVFFQPDLCTGGFPVFQAHPSLPSLVPPCGGSGPPSLQKLSSSCCVPSAQSASLRELTFACSHTHIWLLHGGNATPNRAQSCHTISQCA